MTDETKTTPAAPEPPVDTVVAVAGDDSGVQAVAEISVQGNRAVLVAQFADMDTAKAAYYALLDAEAKRAIDIDGVLVVNADFQGKVHIQKMTDHKTRNGFLWGAVGGAVIGLIFAPAVLAGAAAVGIAGALVGKAGNVMTKSAARRRAGGCHHARDLGHRGPRGASPRSTRSSRRSPTRRSSSRSPSTTRPRTPSRRQPPPPATHGELTRLLVTRYREPGPDRPGSPVPAEVGQAPGDLRNRSSPVSWRIRDGRVVWVPAPGAGYAARDAAAPHATAAR